MTDANAIGLIGVGLLESAIAERLIARGFGVKAVNDLLELKLARVGVR